MRILILGGTKGIGKLLADHFNATAISRITGHGVPHDNDKIIDLSLSYDIIINCIPDANQNDILQLLWDEHKKNNLKTYFITIGSMGYRLHPMDHPKGQLQHYAEQLLYEKCDLKHTLVNLSWCFNSTDDALLTLISEQYIIDIFDFLIKQKEYDSMISLIEIKGK